MKTIVCFGDSNTWGADPLLGGRLAPDRRWTGVLQNKLGPDYRVIEEGLNGRTTNLDDIIEEDRNGRKYLSPCLQSHQPLDAVTIMLGTNDLKARFQRSASDIAQSAAALGNIAANMPVGPDGGYPKVLLISPPRTVQLSNLAEMFAGAAEKSAKFGELYGWMTEGSRMRFFDAGSVIVSSQLDGIHFDADQHLILGEAIATELLAMIG